MTPAQLADLLSPWLEVGPAYKGLATGLRGLVLDGRLPVGTQVPSERNLAQALVLGRNTVTAAYDLLRSEGYLSSAYGAGSRVQLPTTAPVRPDQERADSSGVWDLTVAALPAPAPLLDALAAATRAFSPHLSGHGLHPLGLPELRDAVAGHLTDRGLTTGPEQILVTNGALQGWNLLVQALTRPGDRIMVEQPTYPGVIDSVVAQRRRVVALPVTATGWDPPASAARLAHVTPDAQNPTGLVASVEQRQSLLRQLHSEEVVCDETFADLILDDIEVAPLASLGRDVVTVGSMSKAFWAGLRIGWVRAAPDVVARLAQIRASYDLASPVLEQMMARWCLDHAGELLPPRLAQLRRHRDEVATALSTRFPDWRFHVPAGGLVLWVEVPSPGATALAAHALDLGLRIAVGPRFTADGTADRWFRLPFHLDQVEVDVLMDLLGQAQERAAARVPSAQKPSVWTA